MGKGSHWNNRNNNCRSKWSGSGCDSRDSNCISRNISGNRRSILQHILSCKEDFDFEDDFDDFDLTDEKETAKEDQDTAFVDMFTANEKSDKNGSGNMDSNVCWAKKN